MNAPILSDELIAWAELAGYALTPETDDGAAIFWTNPGGELRFYIRSDPGRLETVSLAERSSAEQVRLFGTSDRVVERYLFGVFGGTVRSRLRLPRVLTPLRAEELAAGFGLSDVDADGYRSLLNAEGLVAKCGDKISSIPTLVKLAYLLTNPVNAIMASYQDPTGSPLFSLR